MRNTLALYCVFKTVLHSDIFDYNRPITLQMDLWLSSACEEAAKLDARDGWKGKPTERQAQTRITQGTSQQNRKQAGREQEKYGG